MIGDKVRYLGDNAIALIIAVIASSGFWAWLQKKTASRSRSTKLLMGLAMFRMTDMGMLYLERGWITFDEFGDFEKYLYQPYKELGGNGSADRIMNAIKQLPLVSNDHFLGDKGQFNG